MTHETHAVLRPDMLQLKRVYSARRERLWRAWTEPERIKRWLSSPEWALHRVELALRVGGAYRFFFRSPKGETTEVFGEYETVDEPSLLVFTWAVSGACENVEGTRVKVEFIERADGTELRLTHEGFTTPKDRDNHLTGWLECFEAFERVEETVRA